MSPECRWIDLIKNILDFTYVILNIPFFIADKIGKHKYTKFDVMNLFDVRK